jgi:exosortase E/protease (VPEID-CTERM system)
MNETAPLAIDRRDTNCRAEAAAGPALSPLRTAVLAAVLLAEILYLTLRFDTAGISLDSGWPAWLLSQSPHVLRAAIAMLVATLLFGGVQIWRDGEQLAKEGPVSSGWPLYLVAHFAVFAAFVLLTQSAFDVETSTAANFGWWTLAWWCCGLMTLGFLMAAIFPPPLWLALARKAAPAILGGMAVGLAAWVFGLVTGELWLPLGQATFWTVSAILKLATSDVFCDAQNLVIGISDFRILIAPACSGYEGIGLILMFLGVYVWLFRADLRFPQVFLLFPLGALLIWLANALRIAALIGIGAAGWEDVALGGFHSQAGWLAFNGLALGFVVLTNKVQFFRNTAGAPKVAEARTNATAAYLAPLMAILAAAMITGAVTAEFDWLYPLRVLAGGAVLWYFRKDYGSWDWSFSWQALGLGAATCGLWLLLAPSDMFEASGVPTTLTTAPPALALAWLAFRLLGYAFIVPLAEELAFRGYLTRRLIQKDFQKVALGRFTLVSFVVSSVLFGLMHGSCWFAGILAGMLFAVALRHRGRLADAVAAHAAANGCLAVYALSTGQWSMWS